MDQPIMFTGRELVDGVLAICAAIITISAALTIIIKAVKALKAPDKKQNERLQVLEDKVKKIEGRLELGKKRFETETAARVSMQESLSVSVSVIIKTLQALTTHALDGSNTEDLKEAQKELNDYLTDNLVKGNG